MIKRLLAGCLQRFFNLFAYFPDGKAEERLSTIARKRKSVSGIHFCPFLVAYTHESVSLFHAFRWWGASFKIVRGENEGKKSPLVFFSPRLFFAHALLSERLEQATSPLTNHLKYIIGPFIRGKIRRVLNKTRTVPFIRACLI